MHDEYTELDQLLHEEDFVKHKLRDEQRFWPVLSSLLTSNYRHDYFPSTGQFVLRMPSVLLEAITTSVIEEILRQLRSIAGTEGLSAGFAQAIEHGGSVHIVFDDPELARMSLMTCFDVPEHNILALSSRYLIHRREGPWYD
jgi:hypothetical protein